jgi:hypothetical protein
MLCLINELKIKYGKLLRMSTERRWQKVGVLTYEKVRISGSINILYLKDLEMTCKPNVHAEAYFKAVIEEEREFEDLEKELKNTKVTIDCGEDSPLFCGIVFEVKIVNNNRYYEVEVWLKSGSWLLDQEKKSKSFQDKSMLYVDVIDAVLEDTDGSFVILEDYTRKIEKPLIQYLETDWEFCKRLASHYETSLYPELTRGEAMFYLGMPKGRSVCKFDETEYSVIISGRYYELGGANSGLERKDFLCYRVEGYENYKIGSPASFKGKNWVIAEKSCEFRRGLVVFTYLLAQKEYIYEKRSYNEKISGMSILGTVLETANETLKIHLDIDEKQDIATAHQFDWIPATGNLMYLMPKVGTRVSLYFYNEDERSAKAINCVRTNGGEQCPEMANYNNRYLTTEHNKRMYLVPTGMGLIGTSGVEDKPLQMSFDDEEGIVFQSHKNLNMMAA